MIAIPNMEKPKNCAECFRILKCKAVPRWVTADDSIPKGCPLIEIVECKDCKYWTDDMSGNMWCEHAIGGLTEPTDFCSYGERRADERVNRILADK